MSGGILLVDDDPDALIVLKIILEGEGYTIYTVNNLDQVKAIVIEYKICLAIIDFILLGCHGKQVAKALKEIDEKLQIIFLSGHEDVFEAANDLKFNVYRVFIKPENIDELLSAIRSICIEENSRHKFHNSHTNIVKGNVGGQLPHL